MIIVGDYRIGVLEACSGLGMLSAFFALSTTVALVVNRPTAERVAVFLSAAPIGVLMNLVRITATAYVYATLGSAAAHAFFHDLAGWLMMPLAFAALWLELALLRPAVRRRSRRPRRAAGFIPAGRPRTAGINPAARRRRRLNAEIRTRRRPAPSPPSPRGGEGGAGGGGRPGGFLR